MARGLDVRHFAPRPESRADRQWMSAPTLAGPREGRYTRELAHELAFGFTEGSKKSD